MRQLAPVPDASTITLDAALRAMDTTRRVQPPQSARLTAIVPGDSALGAVTMFEYDEMFVLQIQLYNNSSRAFNMDPKELILMDGSRVAFMRLQTHEASNLFAGRVVGIPRYEPKYSYEFTATTYGTLQTNGNLTYLNAQTQGEIRRVEDPYDALGYSIGAAIAANRNKKYQSMASTIYQLGLGESSTVAAKTGGIGAVYWLRREPFAWPLILRFGGSGYEVRFNR